MKLFCRRVVHTKSNGGGVVPTRRSLDALQTNDSKKAFVLDGSMEQNLKNELTSPRFCGGAVYRAENMNWIGERRHEIGYATGRGISTMYDGGGRGEEFLQM